MITCDPTISVINVEDLNSFLPLAGIYRGDEGDVSACFASSRE